MAETSGRYAWTEIDRSAKKMIEMYGKIDKRIEEIIELLDKTYEEPKDQTEVQIVEMSSERSALYDEITFLQNLQAKLQMIIGMIVIENRSE